MASLKSYISPIIVFVIFVLVFWGLTYTADWENYEYFYNGKEDSRDFAFAYLVDVFNNLNAEYRILYRFHILLMGVFYVIFLRRIKASAWILILFMVLNFVAMGNQIRYYVALPLTYIALYEFSVKKNLMAYSLITVLSVLTHFGVVVFQLCFFITYYAIYYLRKQSILLIILINLICLSVLVTGFGFQERYLEYLDAEWTSSWAGGIYNVIPSLVSVLCIVLISRCVENEQAYAYYDYDDEENVIVYANDYDEDEEYQENDDSDELFHFLFVMSVCTSLLLLPSLQMQILCNRFISTCLPIWIAFSVKAFSFSSYNKWWILFFMSFLVVLPLLWTYVLPFMLGIDPHFVVEAVLMIESYEF